VTTLVLTTNGPARATDLRRDTWLSIVHSHHAVSKCPDPGAPSVPLPSLPDAWHGDVDALVMKYQQNPLSAARAYAYVAVAMRDAWKLLSFTYPCDIRRDQLAASTKQ
jgi:hypothetical protein